MNNVRHIGRIIGEYLLAAGLTVIGLVLVMQLWNANWSVPFQYHGDSLIVGLSIKSMADFGWFLHNPQLGAPFELDLHDFPQGGLVHFGLLKLMTLFTHDAGLIFNLYFLLTFPLAAITALFVLRHFGVGYLPALLASVLFAFMPHHFCAGPGHMLTVGFPIPLMVMLILWLYQDPDFLYVERGDGEGKRFGWLSGKTWAAVLLAAIVASCFVYFAFFGCFFLLLCGLANALSRKSMRPLRAAGFLILVLVATTCANNLPSFLYGLGHGGNSDAARRSMGEAEHFGMRIAQLMMPVTGHRVPLLAWAKARFNNKLALVTENDYSALGVIGSIGFLMLIARLLVRGEARQPGSLREPLALCNVFAVLLATIGGFGLLCAAALPQIRAYNRMSMFISFFALFAVALSLDSLRQKMSATPGKRLAYWCLIAALLVIGVLDQTPGTWSSVASDPARLAEFQQDAEFMGRIENSVPAEAMIYQLPYCIFPEGPNYDGLRCYFHAPSLRWSFPTMRGRTGDLWNRDLIEKPLDDQVATLIFAGFQGLFIDRGQYQDRGKKLEARLERMLGQKPAVSANARFAFFNLGTEAERMRRRYTTAQWEVKRQRALQPVLVSWSRGFSHDLNEQLPDGRWCAAQGEMCLFNLAKEPRKLTVSLAVRAGKPAHLQVSSPFFSRDIVIDAGSGSLEETITLPPGRHSIRFACDASPSNDDPRRIFRMIECHMRDE